MPVVRLVFLFTAHVQQICTTTQSCRYIKNDDHEPRTTNHQISFNIKVCSSRGGGGLPANVFGSFGFRYVAVEIFGVSDESNIQHDDVMCVSCEVELGIAVGNTAEV